MATGEFKRNALALAAVISVLAAAWQLREISSANTASMTSLETQRVEQSSLLALGESCEALPFWRGFSGPTSSSESVPRVCRRASPLG